MAALAAARERSWESAMAQLAAGYDAALGRARSELVEFPRAA